MSNPPGWVQVSKNAQRSAVLTMAGIEAGVVTAAQVESQPSNISSKMNDPATWTYVFVGASFLYLFGVYYGMIRVNRVGEV